MRKNGRPTEYKEEYIDDIDVYLKECKDAYEMIEDYKEVDGMELKNEDDELYMKGKTKERKHAIIKVKLPSIERYALRLNVSNKTLYNWAEQHESFLHALDKIRAEQKLRLMEMGLSGEYNSTIAKLILSANHGMVERQDLTTDGKELPTPIYGGKSKIQKHTSDGKDIPTEEKN